MTVMTRFSVCLRHFAFSIPSSRCPNMPPRIFKPSHGSTAPSTYGRIGEPWFRRWEIKRDSTTSSYRYSALTNCRIATNRPKSLPLHQLPPRQPFPDELGHDEARSAHRGEPPDVVGSPPARRTSEPVPQNAHSPALLVADEIGYLPVHPQRRDPLLPAHQPALRARLDGAHLEPGLRALCFAATNLFGLQSSLNQPLIASSAAPTAQCPMAVASGESPGSEEYDTLSVTTPTAYFRG